MEAFDYLPEQAELRHLVRDAEDLVRSHAAWTENALKEIDRQTKAGESAPGADYVVFAFAQLADAFETLRALPYYQTALKTESTTDLASALDEPSLRDFALAAAKFSFWRMLCTNMLTLAASLVAWAGPTATAAHMAKAVVWTMQHEPTYILKMCDAITQQVLAGGNTYVALATALSTANLKLKPGWALHTATGGNRDVLLDEAMQETVSVWPDFPKVPDIKELRNAVSRGITSMVDRHTVLFDEADPKALQEDPNAISMEDQFEAKETMRQLITDAELTLREQEMLEMRYTDDLLQKAIADRLGVHEGTVATTLSRGRNKIGKAHDKIKEDM